MNNPCKCTVNSRWVKDKKNTFSLNLLTQSFEVGETILFRVVYTGGITVKEKWQSQSQKPGW